MRLFGRRAGQLFCLGGEQRRDGAAHISRAERAGQRDGLLEVAHLVAAGLVEAFQIPRHRTVRDELAVLDAGLDRDTGGGGEDRREAVQQGEGRGHVLDVGRAGDPAQTPRPGHATACHVHGHPLAEADADRVQPQDPHDVLLRIAVDHAVGVPHLHDPGGCPVLLHGHEQVAQQDLKFALRVARGQQATAVGLEPAKRRGRQQAVRLCADPRVGRQPRPST